VSNAQVRIISDLHYGDRVSAVTDFSQLAPLLANTQTLILNGDTTDTRPGPDPELKLRVLTELEAFTRQSTADISLITGNHDPDISQIHLAEIANGQVLVTHGDILFENIVPWGRDAALATELVNQARNRTSMGSERLESLLQAHRLAAAGIPQRHQSERNGLRYFTSFLTDTIWPPKRIFHILNSWRTFPARAEALVSAHRPKARFLIGGHTHWPGIWRRPDGLIVINTGSYCPPSGRLMVELDEVQLRVRRIVNRRGDFLPGAIVAQFALTPGDSPSIQVP
jgi:predicted phosphodiesterase